MNETLQQEFGTRLVKLSNGKLGLMGGMEIKASVPADANGEPIVDFRSSNERIDRYDEIVVASGWLLDDYKRNPVFQDSHNYSSILRTIGNATITEVRGTELFQRVKFAVDINPLATVAYKMYRDGFLHAVSVGFIPHEWEQGSDKSGYRRKFTKQELLETSAVGIPANPDALTLAVKTGSVSKGDLKEIESLLRHICNTPAKTGPEIKHLLIQANAKAVCPHCGTEIPEKGLKWVPEPGVTSKGHWVHVVQDCNGKVRFPQADDEAFQKFCSSEKQEPSPTLSAQGLGADGAQLLQQLRDVAAILKRA